ncbi:tyrosine-type recombinase/integrase [Polaromonas jejuensis]|uniref:tyrosine-type recombinase/integrase n=1 Tax=Polaromonas jejuensis TaxID=457502 RepID=UPI00083AC880
MRFVSAAGRSSAAVAATRCCSSSWVRRCWRQGAEFEAAAAHLEQASTHWMRRTAGSHLSEKADLKVVRDNLGHANISTTSIYLHSEDDARHDATAAVHRVGWRTP